jgi:hypothetical protein
MLTEEQIKEAVDKALEKYKALPMFNAVSMVMEQITEMYHVSAYQDYREVSNQVDKYLLQQLADKNLFWKKGKSGGIYRPINQKNKVAINDYICPCCGNDRCSKSELICWKCGGNL